MTFVVTDGCIRCKYTDCVEVCPVDCFHEGESMLVIDPDECIDCGVCEPECPVDAIKDDKIADADKWAALGKKFSAQWPRITSRISAAADAESFKGQPGKFEAHFSPKPGRGT